jgi:hypothetical protein
MKEEILTTDILEFKLGYSEKELCPSRNKYSVSSEWKTTGSHNKSSSTHPPERLRFGHRVG